MDMKIGHYIVQDVSEFVREWTGPGDPTGLSARLDDPPKKRDLDPERVEAPREPIPARETSDKE